MSVVFNPGDNTTKDIVEYLLRDKEFDPSPLGHQYTDRQVAAHIERLALPGPDDWPKSRAEAQRILDAIFDNGSVVPSTPTPESPLVPTEPGIYVDNDAMPWTLDSENVWSYGGTEYPNGMNNGMHVQQFGPFTRIDTRESWRASWAAEIADWIDERFGFNPTTAVGVTAAIRREFGGAVVDE